MSEHRYSHDQDGPRGTDFENNPVFAPREVSKTDPTRWGGYTPGPVNPYHGKTDDRKTVMGKFEDDEQRDQ